MRDEQGPAGIYLTACEKRLMEQFADFPMLRPLQQQNLLLVSMDFSQGGPSAALVTADMTHLVSSGLSTTAQNLPGIATVSSGGAPMTSLRETDGAQHRATDLTHALSGLHQSGELGYVLQQQPELVQGKQEEPHHLLSTWSLHFAWRDKFSSSRTLTERVTSIYMYVVGGQYTIALDACFPHNLQI